MHVRYQGRRVPEYELTVYSDAGFALAKARPIARYRQKPGASATFDYQPGDYAAHIEHGIGRFEGVVTMQAATRARISGPARRRAPTADGSRRWVTRYVGMGETAPALSNLGSAEWSRAKARVKESSRRSPKSCSICIVSGRRRRNLVSA